MPSQTLYSHVNVPPTNRFINHFILNIAKFHSHLISYNIHGIILYAFTVKHCIM